MSTVSIVPDTPIHGLDEIDRERALRMPYPPVPEGEQGNYGALTNGQRFARHLPPAISDGIGVLAGALLRDGALPPALREIIIVRVGYLTGSRYEVLQHRSLAARFGVTAAVLDKLTLNAPSGLPVELATLIAFVDAIVLTNRADDAVLDAVRTQFDDRQVIETIAVTGMWWTLSRILTTGDVPVDDVRIGDKGVMTPSGKP